ncbi:MAG TPA: hypothetical protein PK511_06035 [Chitinophagales bacterium]|nr:hypothetical protein [Chitinophagales bacterium]HMU68830.1 hypothetical protein [Chitinophagales bacterium]HMX03622.1 hypothetical protein [Chitinophagales bacterium]HMZ89835.1 hypothetical protein [Chitinophagales bacterium]HNA58740.1 hypothetical protein [Chitinophagales bacterium]
MFKYTTNTLKKIEDLLKEAGYIVRYERGNFMAGYCILESKKVVVINRYYETESRINSLLEIMGKINLEGEELSESSRDFLHEIQLQTVKV